MGEKGEICKCIENRISMCVGVIKEPIIVFYRCVSQLTLLNPAKGVQPQQPNRPKLPRLPHIAKSLGFLVI